MRNAVYVLCTVQPFGVVLSCAERRHVPQAAVDHRVTPRKINHCGSIEVTAFCYHGSGIVFGVVRAAGDPVHCFDDIGEIGGIAGGADGRERISATGEETRTAQEEDTHVVLTLILRQKRGQLLYINFKALLIS